ncbi:restriction endonuclease subunit S [Isoptericola aurantiacus]|uniref:restriction endonuclease subunit S n=1 Tax=Isoptericola aurantiacus TaxID=3377839 RepID=UPI00383A6F1E
MAEATIGSLAKRGVLSMGDGYRTKRSEHGTPGYRIIRVADVRDGAVYLDGDDFVSVDYEVQMGAKVAVAGDVLLTTKGTVGRVAVMPGADEPAVYSPQLCYFRVHQQDVLDPRFLRYWLQSTEFLSQAAYLQGNTDMAPYISLADLRAARITVPPVTEQRAIADVLGALDDKIAANTQLATTADELTLALLAPESSAIPLGSIADISRQSVDPALLDDPVVAHYSLPAFDANGRPEEVAPATIKSSKFLVDAPSVLFSKLNPRFPRIWNLAELSDIPALASTEFVVLMPRYGSPSLLWALVAQPRVGKLLEGMVAGTSGSHQRVKPTEMLEVLVPDPRDLPEVLVNQVEALAAAARAARGELPRLEALRDSLLPALMSGRLRVEEAAEVAGL